MKARKMIFNTGQREVQSEDINIWLHAGNEIVWQEMTVKYPVTIE